LVRDRGNNLSPQAKRAKIVQYLASVGTATRNEIIKATKVEGRTLTNVLNELVEEGVIELVSEQPKTFKYVGANTIVLNLNEIKDYGILRFEILRNLKKHGWRISPYRHEIAVVALMYSKFTEFRTLIFGSQAVGKTSLIQAVFHELSYPLIVEDLHLKKLYDVLGTVKKATKVIEEQYRHSWGQEIPSKFDQYRVIPISKIGPSDLLFRFIPVRIIQPTGETHGLFSPVRFEFVNVPKLDTLSKRSLELLAESLAKYEYFTLDFEQLKQKLESIRLDELVNYTGDVSVEIYRVNARYDRLEKNDVLLANWKPLREFDDLYESFASDLQIWNNAVQVLRFNLAWFSENGKLSLEDEERAVRDTVQFILDAFNTFTVVRER